MRLGKLDLVGELLKNITYRQYKPNQQALDQYAPKGVLSIFSRNYSVKWSEALQLFYSLPKGRGLSEKG
jgi:hypothetical protein